MLYAEYDNLEINIKASDTIIKSPSHEATIYISAKYTGSSKFIICNNTEPYFGTYHKEDKDVFWIVEIIYETDFMPEKKLMCDGFLFIPPKPHFIKLKQNEAFNFQYKIDFDKFRLPENNNMIIKKNWSGNYHIKFIYWDKYHKYKSLGLRKPYFKSNKISIQYIDE
jgi:hypothetical protein